MLFLLTILLSIAALFFLWRTFARSSKVTHAGGIVVKMQQGNALYLLVSAKNNEHRWVLPKGHVDEHESTEKAALREVKEEAGITAMINHHVGEVHGFKDGYRPIKTSFYLMQYIKETTNTENRKLKWCTLNEAIKTASRGDQKKILKML